MFHLNAKALADPNKTRALEPSDEVSIVISHDEQTAAYEIKIEKKDDENCVDSSLESGIWTIPVRSHWRVATVGSIVGYGLTKKEFYLEPGTSGEQQGYFVRRDQDAEDVLETSPAVMASVFSTSRNWRGVVPLSFGVNFDDDNLIYLVGAGMRFGTVFANLGAAIGHRNRLPTGVSLGDFTQNAELLESLLEKRDLSWFIGISFPLWRGDLPRLQAVVKQPTP